MIKRTSGGGSLRHRPAGRQVRGTAECAEDEYGNVGHLDGNVRDIESEGGVQQASESSEEVPWEKFPAARERISPQQAPDQSLPPRTPPPIGSAEATAPTPRGFGW